MPSNTNYVCFDCRFSVRKPKNHTDRVYCPNCGKENLRLTYKIAIPPHDKPKEWKILQKLVESYEENREIFYLRQGRIQVLKELLRLRKMLRQPRDKLEKIKLKERIKERKEMLGNLKKQLFIKAMITE